VGTGRDVPMQEFFIFSWIDNNVTLIEAYPVHKGLSRQYFINHCISCTDINGWALVSSPSRNQAKKSAYINWINSTGKGWNRYYDNKLR